MGNETAIKNWKQIQSDWIKFVSFVNKKITKLEKKLKEEIIPEGRKCEVFLRELYKGRDNFEFLVKHRESLINFDSDFINIFNLYDAFNESQALENSAYLEVWQALTDNKILQFESRIEENKQKRKDIESKLSELYDLVDERSYGAIKSLLEEFNLTPEEIVNILIYVGFNASRKSIVKEKTNPKFKSTNNEEVNNKKQEEISKNIDIEISRFEGIKEKFKDVYSEFYNQFKSFGTTNINAIRYDIKSETLLSGLELYLQLETIRKDIEEVLNLINNGEIDDDNFELLKTSINEFQSISDKLAIIYEQYMKELSSPKEETEQINPNVFFYVVNPHNPSEADKANVFADLVTKVIDDDFFIKNRTKQNNENPDVAGKKIYFKEFKNSVISFIKTGGYGDDSRILVLASISIKNNGTDKIHKLTERVTRNEEEIKNAIEAIESLDPEFISIQDMIRMGLLNKKKSSESQKRR